MIDLGQDRGGDGEIFRTAGNRKINEEGPKFNRGGHFELDEPKDKGE